MKNTKTVSLLVLGMCLAIGENAVFGARNNNRNTRSVHTSMASRAKASRSRGASSNTSRVAMTANKTSSSTDSLLTNLVRFVGNVYGDTLKYGQSYALQDMFTPETYNYYYANGSANVNDSGSVLDEQFCFGPYMTLVGRDGTTDAQVYTYKSENKVTCATLQKGVVYSLSLIEATDTELTSALTTTGQANLPNDGRRFAYVARSESPVSTIFFNTERYFDVTKYVKAITSAIAKAKSSCGDFSGSMNKLRSELGWSAVASGAGVALSGASTVAGVVNLKKTDAVTAGLDSQAKIESEMDSAISGNNYYWEEKDIYVGEGQGKKINNVTELQTGDNAKKLTELNAKVQPQDKLDEKAVDLNTYEKCWTATTDANEEKDENQCESCTWNPTTKKCDENPVGTDKCNCKFSTTVKGKGFHNYAGYKDTDDFDDCDEDNKSKDGYNSDRCKKYRDNVAVWNNSSEEFKKQMALPNLYAKAMKQKENYSDLGNRASALNNLSAKYKSNANTIENEARASHTLDIAQATLSGVSTVASGVTVVLSLSAIGEVDKALSTLKTCKTDMANLSAVYNEYMAEAYDEYQDFLKAKDENSGAAYDYDD